jgi:hypothetical protein
MSLLCKSPSRTRYIRSYQHTSMKKALLVVALFAIGSFLQAQDTTQYLFKRAKYSYMQYSMGYSPIYFKDMNPAHGFSACLFGVVFNDKISIGFDIVGASSPQNPISVISESRVLAYVQTGLNVEALIRSKKVINFSVPTRLAFGGITYDEIQLNGTYIFHNQAAFFVAEPGAMVWINLFKYLSLGGGAGYRMTFNKEPDTFERFSGMNGYATLRLKFYTKEFQEKQMQMWQQRQPEN